MIVIILVLLSFQRLSAAASRTPGPRSRARRSAASEPTRDMIITSIMNITRIINSFIIVMITIIITIIIIIITTSIIIIMRVYFSLSSVSPRIKPWNTMIAT